MHSVDVDEMLDGLCDVVSEVRFAETVPSFVLL